MNQGLPPIVRFVMKYKIVDSGCWEWIGATTGRSQPLQYGRFYTGGSPRTVLPHRWIYEKVIGEIPEGLQIDHLCRNTLCVNPAHLEPVTRRVNVMRGTSPNARNMGKTHCIRGHELTQANCYSTKWPRFRECKECARMASRAKANKRQTNSLASAERNAEAVYKAIQEIGG